MTKTELKKKQKHNEMLLQAKERLIEKGFKSEYKEEIDRLLEYVRPEHMTSDTFNNECKKSFEKFMLASESDIYDEYEKEVIKNSAYQIIEFRLKAYLTVCYY